MYTLAEIIKFFLS